MRGMLIGGIALAACSVAAGWHARGERDKPPCEFLSGSLPVYEGHIQKLPNLNRNVPAGVMPFIYACYEEHPVIEHISPAPILRLQDARRLTPDSFLLAFSMGGVADHSLLIEVSDDGKLRQAYGYPYTLTKSPRFP
jgi:hypothetical protein